MISNEPSRAEMRAELHRIQEGRCAACGVIAKLVMDHDHETGFCRGLLCQSCNVREGKRSACAEIDAYLANPPAAAFDWLWQMPDWWRPADTSRARRLGVTFIEYIRAYGAERLRETDAAMADIAFAIGRSRQWGSG